MTGKLNCGRNGPRRNASAFAASACRMVGAFALIAALLCPDDASAMQRCPIPVAPADAPLTDAGAGGVTTAALDGCTPPDPRPNPLPTVSLTAPASGASAYAPGSFVIAASASDADGIEEVEFRANGVSLYRDRTAPYAYSWSNIGVGNYILVAVARDSRGATRSSATRIVTVKARPVLKGYIDSVPKSGADYYVRGWACATTLPQSINVHAYVGGAAGTGTHIGSFAANLASESAVATACQSTGTRYRFQVPLSIAVRQKHVGKKIYIHGISPVGGAHNLLTRSGLFTVPAPPVTTPTVSLTSPSDGLSAYAPGNFVITASASDADGIAHVDFKANGTLLYRDTTAPYSYLWDDAAVGSHILQAVAQDKLGATKTSASRWVTVLAERSGSATINIVAPSDGANIAPGSSVTVQSNARPIYDGVELTSHKLLHNGVVVASKDLDGVTIKDTLSKTLSGLPTGIHKFVSTATTSGGQTYTSSLVTITVNWLPSVSLTAPANGAGYVAPATVVLKADATDSDGSVSRVEFYNGGTLLATDHTAPYVHTWSEVPDSAAPYAIHARAYDNLGKSRLSAAHNITVNAQPTVSISRSPIWSSMLGPATVTLSASAADSDGISKVEFYSGATLLATDTAAPYSHKLTGLATGSYSFKVKAYDTRGGVKVSTANSLAVVDEGVTRTYVYDTQQRLCKTIEPETGATIVDYDAAGNVAWTASGQPHMSTTDCERDSVTLGQRVTRQYDSRNRVRIVDFPDNRGNTIHDYWPDGLVRSVSADDGTQLVTTTYAYNRRRLLESERVQWSGFDWQIGYGYNGNGHLDTQYYPSDLVVDFAPNALGQPERAGSYATGVRYYPNGAIKQFTYGNGIVHTLYQNERGLAERSCDALGDCESYSATAVHDDSYDYDFNGNVAAISDGLEPYLGNRTMTYDSLDRLTRVVSPMFGGDNTAVFGYDPFDNLLHARVGGISEANYEYDEHNRLTNVRNSGGQTVVGLGYDVRGNVENRNGELFDFDYGNRLRSISGTANSSYVYDGLGRRVRDTSGAFKDSLYSKAGQLLYTNNNRAKKYTDYVYLAGSLVATRERPHGGGVFTRYHHTDALGSPVVVTDESRQVRERSFYAPYGAQIDGSTKDGVGYTGHVMDAASGLTYMQQRYYDPELGRFLSVDPVTAYSSGDIRHFNAYAYAYNNPYRFTDPDGRQSDEIGLWIRALWDNNGDFEKAKDQVNRRHEVDRKMVSAVVDVTAVGIVKDAVEVSVKVANSEDATGQGAGAVAGEVAGQVAEAYLDGKIGDGAAAAVGAAVGKATGDTVETVVDNSRGGNSSGGSAATQPEPVKPPEPVNLRDKR